MLFITYIYHIFKIKYIYIYIAIWDLPPTGKYTNCEFAHLDHNKTHDIQLGAPLSSHLPGRLHSIPTGDCCDAYHWTDTKTRVIP